MKTNMRRLSLSRRKNNRTFTPRPGQKHPTLLESLEKRELLAADFTLQILHASDLEGGVEAIEAAPNFAAVVQALERSAADAGTPSILLSAGDNYIPGPFFNAAGDRAAFRDSGLFNDIYNELFGVSSYDALREGNGRVDISIMNVIGFDASAVGNHEFDAGSDAFESIIEEDFRSLNGPESDRWVGAQFPYLSANLDFSADADLSNLYTPDILPSTDFATGPTQSTAGNASVPKIAPATIIHRDGQDIGVVGATTQIINSISSPAGTVDSTGGVVDIDALASTLQPVIDQLTGPLAVNKVILVSHLQQISLEQELATKLDGVDIIIAGGSDTILANDDDTLQPDDEAGDTYPVLATDLSGNPTAIVSTDGQYSYVGQLTVNFDAAGILVDNADTPIDEVADLDPTLNGPIPTTDQSVTDLWGNLTDPFALTTKGEKVQRLVDAVTDVVNTSDGAVFGQTDVYLDGRRERVRTQETNLGNTTADANLFAARSFDPTVDISIKNGGGIRASIGQIDGTTGELLPTQPNPGAGKNAGEISQLDIENSLRFNNGLTLLTVSATELKSILEFAVSASAPGATPGRFPQVGGLRFSFDPNAPAIQFNSDADIAGGAPLIASDGSRIVNVALIDENGDTTQMLIEDGVVLNPTQQIRMVTLDFLFGIFSSSPNFGGDGYPFPALASDVVQLKDQALPAGIADFASPGTEQDAFAEYLAENFPADALDPLNQKPSITNPEREATLDRRIQDLSVRADTLISTSGPLTVTNGDNFGPGSLRYAVQVAGDNPGVNKIIISDDVDLITLEQTAEYIGTHNLRIYGNHAVIQAAPSFADDGIFISSNAANVQFKDITFDGAFQPGQIAANGIFMPVPITAQGTINVSLNNVTLLNNGLFGLHIADQINDSPASIKLRVHDTDVRNNGIGALDYDGIRVDEGGDGNIKATISWTHIDANGGDGLELDERGNGRVNLLVESSTFNENGFFNEEDLDDGLDVDEAGAGSVFVKLRNVELNDNLDEGLDLDEEDAGSIRLDAGNILVNRNLDEGVKVSEEGAGNLFARIRNVTANENGDDGIELEEEENGRVDVRLDNVTVKSNGDSGLQIAESGRGNLTARLYDVVSRFNTGNGADFEEADNGFFRIYVDDSIFSNNMEFGISAIQGLRGYGLLFLDDVDVRRNTLGNFIAQDVKIIGDPFGDNDDDDEEDEEEDD